jgi:hypothetical protein
LDVGKLGKSIIVNFVKCEGDSRLSFFNLLNSGLKMGLELSLQRTLVYNIHGLGETEVLIFREIYHK